jgi:hypothetical protein
MRHRIGRGPARHVVDRWHVRSPLVAAKHYQQTRNVHFEVKIWGGARE